MKGFGNVYQDFLNLAPLLLIVRLDNNNMIRKKHIKHKQLKKIVDDYIEIQSWLKKHRKRLELLKKDHELLTSDPPYKIHFAVDFHEIYQMVFPLGSEKEIIDVKNSDRDAWFYHKVVSQTGRICLFFGIDPVPVLLPPYRDELEDFLFWLKSKYKKVVDQYQVILELKESIKEALHDEGIEFKKKGEHFEISDENYAKIIRFIKKHFFQLSILLIGGYTEEFSILKSLFSENRIKLVSDRWSEYKGFINDVIKIKKVPDAWYDFIREFRKEKQDDIQNRERDIERANKRDILALHLIKALNKKFKEEKKKEIVLLVSDAEIFQSLLNHMLRDNEKNKTICGVFKTANGGKIEICRTTDLFHTYLLVKKEREELKKLYEQKIGTRLTSDINKVTLINVKNDLHKIGLIERFDKEINRIINFCNHNWNMYDCQNLENCPEGHICLTTKKVIKDFKEDRKSLESLALAEKFDIYTKIYKHYQQISGIDEGAKQILRLLQDDERIGDIINEKLEDIRRNINKGFEKLTENSILREPEPDVLKIPRGNSFRIRTYDEEVDEIIREIQRSIRRNDQKSFSRYFSALKNEKKRLDKTKSLKYLSSSLVAAAYEQYDLALYFLETGLIFEGVKSPLFRELKYLETIIYCNKKKYEKALTLCEELLKNYQDDGRFHYFYGYIILTGKEDSELDGCTYDKAAGYCREALSIFKKTGDDDSDLNLYILNNLIYGLAKIDSPDSIKEAEQYVVELEGCSNPEDDWGYHIWHTVGYVYFKKAELLKGKNEDYSKIISEAIKCFEIADEKARGEISIIKDDLEKARKL